MILDNLTQWRQYAAISPRFKKGFEFLQKVTDLTPEGRNEIDGEDVFAIVVKTTTKPVEGRQLEVHRKYIDVHYVHSGREAMYWSPLATLTNPTMPFDPEQDAALYALVPEAQPLHVDRGQFAIFFPEDAHVPSCAWGQPGAVFKAVLKIRV
ncbi:MAG: DUF386 domain-containing protein [Opitutaceae bacterium]|nr:DUF386 domain-containing protein [Opitutaceae bacterium]